MRQGWTAPDREPTSARLKRLVDEAEGETVTIEWLTSRLGERSFGIVIAALGALAVIPGVSVLAGLLLLVPGLQMILGRPRPVFPSLLGRKRISIVRLRRSIVAVLPYLIWLERWVLPRWFTPFALTRSATGLVVVALALLLLAVPIPFVGVPFGAALMLLAVGYLERDGVVFVTALAVTALIGLGGAWLMFAPPR